MYPDIFNGATGEIRTRTREPLLPPQDSASAYSATVAYLSASLEFQGLRPEARISVSFTVIRRYYLDRTVCRLSFFIDTIPCLYAPVWVAESRLYFPLKYR